MRRLLVTALAGLTLSGCCRDPWSAHPMPVPPDHACATGSGTHGDDVYVWDCYQGKRVVVSQYSAEMSCSAPRQDTAPCGAVTKLETDLGLTATACSSGARPGREWRPAR
jgi:hypothetical protein